MPALENSLHGPHSIQCFAALKQSWTAMAAEDQDEVQDPQDDWETDWARSLFEAGWSQVILQNS